MKTLRQMFRVAAVAMWAASLVGCGNPCRELSEKVCNCQPTDGQRRECLRRVGTRAGQYQPNPDRQVEAAADENCAKVLEQFSCTALASGNLKACGLSLQ